MTINNNAAPLGADLRWGVLGCAKIARTKLLPGLLKARGATLAAIASRHLERAQTVVNDLDVSSDVRTFGSYDALLSDTHIDAVYIPTPNHLHIPLAIQALAAGKHVLCEKPIARSAEELMPLMAASRRHPNLKVMEAFMYRFHPQWVAVKNRIDAGEIGSIHHIHSMFSYMNTNANDVRNQRDIGGGALLDVGCYSVSLSRFLIGRPPTSCSSHIVEDNRFGTDIHCSGLMHFDQDSAQGLSAAATFYCSTQANAEQHVKIVGSTGDIMLTCPFTPQPDQEVTILLENENGRQHIEVECADQYALQMEAMSHAIAMDLPVPISLEDSLENMKAIDALFNASRFVGH